MSSQIRDEDELIEVLTRPSPELIEFIKKLNGPLLVLGAGGKMGPTLAVLARRASLAAGIELRVIAVSRFSDSSSRHWLDERGIETISADLLDASAFADLPESQNVIHLVGSKFGTSRDPSRTWAVNTLVPSYMMERYPDSRIVALSTGNVYPLTSVAGEGSRESDPLTPIGEYANAAVGRERILEYYSRKHGTRVVVIRLNYATDLRYGVLTDIARKVVDGESVDVSNGYLNCIWQGDANDRILRALPLAASPPFALNLTGPEKLSVRALAEEFGRLLGKPVRISGTEADTALLSNSAESQRLLGGPSTSIQDVVRWTAAWVAQGGRLLDKPTHFEVRDGKF